jgi:large subunit ribosomal protein L24e
MKSNPRKLKWTKAFRKAAGKEMVVDSTLAFNARRHVPVRYNRELVADTLRTMKRVEEIRQKRERAFYKNRMRGNLEKQKEEDRKLVTANPELLRLRDVELRRQTDKELEEMNEMKEDSDIMDEEEMSEEEVEEKQKVAVLVKNKKSKSKMRNQNSMDID